MPVVKSENRCRGGEGTAVGDTIRIVGCLEMSSGWCFRFRYVNGLATTLSDIFSRWDHATINSTGHSFCLDTR